jgi:uncharacterized protein
MADKPMNAFALPTLSLLEARILGVLVEKRHTVADSYPLSLNALVSGCNQKTGRNPVLDASEEEVQAAVDHLKSALLVIESSGSRVARYSHNIDRVLHLPSQSIALLAVLMLRGPQTAGEIRINSERLHKFSDISSVEGFLQELSARAAGPLVVELPRQAGSRENRWMHLLSGSPVVEVAAAAREAASPRGADITVSEIAALRANVSRLQDEVASLKKTVAIVCAELGITAESESSSR